MNEPKKTDDLETATGANGADEDGGAIAAAAALLAQPSQPLDPTRPMFHMVPPATMQDVIVILKRLPYEDVARVMPALMQAPIHQAPPE